MGTVLFILTWTLDTPQESHHCPTLPQNTRKELKLLLQLNPMLGMVPNISLETSIIIKLLLKSHGSQAAWDGLSGSGTHLKPTTSSWPTDSHQQNSTSHCPHLGTWPWENVGKASSVFLFPRTSSRITTMEINCLPSSTTWVGFGPLTKISPYPPDQFVHSLWNTNRVCHWLWVTSAQTVIPVFLSKNLGKQPLLDRYVWLRFVIRCNARHSVWPGEILPSANSSTDFFLPCPSLASEASLASSSHASWDNKAH